jgi:demethylmenaquinone methyltransferase/2-methoxy-6-polyprenyl-1,4-benzoquinol methylase
MAELTGKERAEFVRQMFARLARRYTRANHWMTWGQDGRWRREVIARAKLPLGGRLLDVGTGTGDLALEALRGDESLLVVGGDFTPQMMQAGRMRARAGAVRWVVNDALDLPYATGSFDAVVSGYLLRNVASLPGALAEQFRVLKPGGWWVCLETTPPPRDFWHWPVWFYLDYVIPNMGGLLTGDWAAYRYLPDTTRRFLSAPELVVDLGRAGFRQVGFRRFMGASMAIHWGIK